MHPKYLSISEFSYELAEEQIAKYPLPERDASKLLVYRNGIIEENTFKNIDEYLPARSLLICNNTKVIEARILFQKSTGAFIEIFCLRPQAQYSDLTTALSQRGNVVWLCLIGGASKWKHGQILQKKIMLAGNEIILEAQLVGKEQTSFAVKISWTPPDLSFSEILHFAGTIPLPPYLKRPADTADHERYQTMYAHVKGSVASPTAGLHFTESIFKKLQRKNILPEYITLHVGAGTFKPVTTDTLEQHNMHAEFFEIGIATLEKLIDHGQGFITAVGTTSLRTLESLYWMGVKTLMNKNISLEQLLVLQWDPYETLQNNIIDRSEALQGLLFWMQDRKMDSLFIKTQILIAPGYTIKIANALVTNFHQPQSTLLLLVAAFMGGDWRKVYKYALNNQFRFLSYGDGCLLFRD